jgi:hypothetical protein
VPIDTDKIVTLRKTLKLSQGSSGKEGRTVQSAALVQHRNGHAALITVPTLEKVAKALGVSARDLLKDGVVERGAVGVHTVFRGPISRIVARPTFSNSSGRWAALALIWLARALPPSFC